MQACALIVLALHCTGIIACSSGGGSPNSTPMLQVTAANVDKIFKLPLREPKTEFIDDVLRVYATSVDLDYNPIGWCTEHLNNSISCWTQVMEAVFDIFAEVSFLNYILEVHRTWRSRQECLGKLGKQPSTTWTWLYSKNLEKRSPISSTSTTDPFSEIQPAF